MSFVKNVQNEWHDLVQKAESLFVSNSSVLVAFLKPWAAQLEQEGKTVLIDAAQAAVTVGEATPGSGEDKMLAALAAFAASCVKESLPYIESEARALIEVALQNFKAALAPATA